MNPRKNNIYELDLAPLANLDQQEFLLAVNELKLVNYSSWLLPQLVAHFGRWQVHNTCRETVVKNCQTLLDQTLYRLTRIRRSYLIKNQTQQPEYAQLTPLVMLGLRQHHNIPYSHWQTCGDYNWILEPELYQALSNPIAKLNVEQLLQIRQQGLQIKSGPKTGTTKPAESTWRLLGITDTLLGNQTPLFSSIVCQIWLAHPKHRRSTMILDPYNWDQMPKPLVDWQPVKPQETNHKYHEQLPWNTVSAV